MEDDQLMRRAQGGDRGAFSVLFERYEKPIYNFLRRLGMIPAEAEEGTQEVFLKLWERRSQYRPGGVFRVYLYQIARNHRIGRFRRPALDARRYLAPRMGGTGGAVGVGGQAIHQDDPAAAAERRELGVRVHHLLDELPEGVREPFVLRWMQQLPYAEVARITGLTVRQAEDRVAAGFERLASRLRPRAEGKP